jgi:large subunit ribosomal protein L35
MKKKVRKSLKRRFKVTKTGKVMFAHQYSSHNKSKKSNKRLRRQKVPGQLAAGFSKNIKKMMGYL